MLKSLPATDLERLDDLRSRSRGTELAASFMVH